MRGSINQSQLKEIITDSKLGVAVQYSRLAVQKQYSLQCRNYLAFVPQRTRRPQIQKDLSRAEFYCACVPIPEVAAIAVLFCLVWH